MTPDPFPNVREGWGPSLLTGALAMAILLALFFVIGWLGGVQF